MFLQTDINVTQNINQLFTEGNHKDDKVICKVVEVMKKIASFNLLRYDRSSALTAESLVSESYLRLSSHSVKVKDRKHFIALSCTTMRHIVIDLARRKTAEKEGQAASMWNTRRDMPSVSTMRKCTVTWTAC